MAPRTGPDVAGLCAALGLHEAARTHRAARRFVNGYRPGRPPLRWRVRQRNGLTWATQNRDSVGHWAPGRMT